jgi:hypothetical protein
MLPHIYKDGGTIAISMPTGEMKMIDTEHKNYDEIVTAIKSGDDESVINLINIAQQLERAIRASADTDNVSIVDGEVLFQGEPIHNTLTDRIIKMVDEGFDVSHMVKFLENLMMNPSFRAVNELYTFLEAGAIPITENGTFLTYKKIREDWKDVYTGTFDNSIGASPEMPRNRVNEDSSQTCSAGLHVCSYEYLPSFGTSPGNRVVICEVEPQHVVSIPDDYNNTKMRVCKYSVIGEVEDYREENVLGQSSVMMTEDVPQPQEPKSDDEIAGHAKALGKMVSNELDNAEVSVKQIADALEEAGLDYDTARSIMNHDNKKVGKRVARFIRDKKINPFAFEDALMGVKAEDGCPSFDDDEDDDNKCPRCGGHIDYGEDECSTCGYFIVE